MLYQKVHGLRNHAGLGLEETCHVSWETWGCRGVCRDVHYSDACIKPYVFRRYVNDVIMFDRDRDRGEEQCQG